MARIETVLAHLRAWWNALARAVLREKVVLVFHRDGDGSAIAGGDMRGSQ